MKKPDVKQYVARAVVYNLLTVDLELPFNIGNFTFYNYPDPIAASYHLGQGEQEAKWDARYPKWHVYIEFPFYVQPDDWPADVFKAEPIAFRILSKLMAVLQLYSTTPIGGRVHAIKPAEKADIADEDIVVIRKDIGANPSDADVYFIANDNLDAIRKHFESLWDRDLRLISLATSRYMHSFERDIFAEGLEPDDAFLDLMLSLDNLFGSPGAVGYKIALRAACLLGESEAERKELNKAIKNWFEKRGKIAHGKGARAVRWEDVEEVRKVVRKAIMAIWSIQKKGDDLDDYLFFREISASANESLPPTSTGSA